MRYQTLLELRVQIAESPPQPCTGVEVRPGTTQPSGAGALARHRLLARPRPDGLDVIAPVDDALRPLIAFQTLTLSFELVLRDPDLALSCDLGALRAASPQGGSALPNDALAAFEVTGVEPRGAGTLRRQVISLTPRPLLWVYYVVSPGPKPVIADADAKRGLSFVAKKIDAPAAAADPVAAALVARRPDCTVYRLPSRVPLSCFGSPPRGLSLQIGTQTVCAELPAPAIDHQMSLPTASGPAKDAIYAVFDS